MAHRCHTTKLHQPPPPGIASHKTADCIPASAAAPPPHETPSKSVPREYIAAADTQYLPPHPPPPSAAHPLREVVAPRHRPHCAQASAASHHQESVRQTKSSPETVPPYPQPSSADSATFAPHARPLPSLHTRADHCDRTAPESQPHSPDHPTSTAESAVERTRALLAARQTNSTSAGNGHHTETAAAADPDLRKNHSTTAENRPPPLTQPVIAHWPPPAVPPQSPQSPISTPVPTKLRNQYPGQLNIRQKIAILSV